jgi:hypothetical protein
VRRVLLCYALRPPRVLAFGISEHVRSGPRWATPVEERRHDRVSTLEHHPCPQAHHGGTWPSGRAVMSRDRQAESGAGASNALGVSDAGPRPVGADAISTATSFDKALLAGLVALCDGRTDVLAHAVWARGPTSPLLPLAVLCGADALEHAALGAALVLASPPGTELTRAVLSRGRAVWTPATPRLAIGTTPPRSGDLVAFGVRSGAGFPVLVRSQPAAVIELLCFGQLERDEAAEAAVACVITLLGVAAERLWRSAPPTDGAVRQGRTPRSHREGREP